MYMKRTLSLDRFFIDFEMVWGGAGEVKMCFSLRRGANFQVFTFPNIRYLLHIYIYRLYYTYLIESKGVSK